VAAIPVTLLWRVAEGRWPSQNLAPRAAAAGAADDVRGRIVGLYGGVVAIGSGVVTAIGDALSANAAPPDALARGVVLLSLAFALPTAVVGFPLLPTARPAPADWVSWVVGLSVGATALFGLNTLTKTGPGVSTKFASGIGAALSVLQLIVVVDAWGQQQHTVLNDVAFGFQVAACVVGVLNPIKFLGAPGAALVAVLDVVMGLALGILQIVKAFEPSKSATALPAAAQVT
jgi:hypothetical protein